MATTFYSYPSRILLNTGVSPVGSVIVSGLDASEFDSEIMTVSAFASRYPNITIEYAGIDITDAADRIYNNNITEWTTVFTLKNGSTLKAKRAYTYFIYSFFDKNGTIIPPGDMMAHSFMPAYGAYTNHKVCFMFMHSNITHYNGVGILQKGTANGNNYIVLDYTVDQYTNQRVEAFLSGAIIDPEDPYITDNNQTKPGGFAGFDYTSDGVDIPALPAISAASCGFVGLYNPTITELQGLAAYMWTGLLDLDTYKKIFGDPMDCILSVGIIPITPVRSVNKEALNFGNFLNTGITAYKITNQFAELDCGSVTIDGSKYTGSAMDYSPYTRAEIFLPFCGTHSISADEIMNAVVSVVYHMDLYTGACVAYVKITKTNSDGSELNSVLYQFTGNVLATIPITGADHSNFIQSILFMGAAAAASVATAGGAAPEINGAMAVGDSVSTSAHGGAAISASGINTVMSMKPNVMRSGNLAANSGFLGLKKPVITLTLPNLCRPTDENKLIGMPCQKSGTLTDFKGFNIVGTCHLDNIPCTMEELRMIDTALAKGVIV